MALLVAMACVRSAVADAPSQPRVRTIAYGMEPIVSRLLPDDEVVVIERDFDTAESPPETSAADFIADAVSRSDLVAVVDVDHIDARLAEDESWIRTRLAGTVREVIRTSKRQNFSRGQRVEMFVNGGELRIGKVMVKASPLRLPAHRQYLLFIKMHGHPTADLASTVPRNSYIPLLIEKGRLVSTWPPDLPAGRPEPLNGLTLSEVAKQVRRVPR